MQKVFLADASVEVPNAPEIFTRPWKPKVDVQITTGMKSLQSGHYLVTLSVTVTAKLEDDTAFLCEAQQAGVFQLQGVDGESRLKQVLGVDCPNMLYPFARESVADMIQRAGFPQLLLQPVDFEALYREHLTARAGRDDKPH